METTAASFASLTAAVAAAERIAYPLAELNDLLTNAPAEEIERLPRPPIDDSYRLNYVTAMVELAAHRASDGSMNTGALSGITSLVQSGGGTPRSGRIC